MAIPMYLRHIGERPSSSSSETSATNGGWTGHYSSWEDDTNGTSSRRNSSGHENVRNRSPITISLEKPDTFPNLNIIRSSDRDDIAVVPVVAEGEVNSKSFDINNYFSNREVFPQQYARTQGVHQDSEEELQLVNHSKTLAGLGISGDVVKSIVNLRPGQFERSFEEWETLNRGVDAINRTSQPGNEVELEEDPEDDILLKASHHSVEASPLKGLRPKGNLSPIISQDGFVPAGNVYSGGSNIVDHADSSQMSSDIDIRFSLEDSARSSGWSDFDEDAATEALIQLGQPGLPQVPADTGQSQGSGGYPANTSDLDGGLGESEAGSLDVNRADNRDEISEPVTAAAATPLLGIHELVEAQNASIKEQPRFVIAIDYGTTYTGIAYTYSEYNKDGAVMPSGRLRADSVKTRFEAASQIAYYKLCSAASNQSPHFRRFVQDLGSHDELIRRGFSALERLLHHEKITSLADVYAFLHVAYAISQTEVATPARSTPVEFRHGLDIMRNCLSTNPLFDDDEQDIDENRAENTYSERNLFDEIVEVMWDEIDFAVAWIGKRTQWTSYCHNMSTRMKTLQVIKDTMETTPFSWPLDSSIVDPGGGHYTLDPIGTSLHHFNTVEGNYQPTHMDVDKNDLNFSGPSNSSRFLVPRIDSPTDPPKTTPSSWLDIVTGSIFLVVIGFLQVIQEIDETFDDIPCAPYSFLCQRDPFIEPDTYISPELSDYREKTNFKFAETIQQQLLPFSTNSKTTQLLSAAVKLVSDGVITTLRSFENYVLGLLRLCNKSMSRLENLEFSEQVLRCCWGLSAQFGECSWRIRAYREEGYNFEYIKKRVFEVDEVFSQTHSDHHLSCNDRDSDSMILDAIEYPILNDNSVETPSMTPDSQWTADCSSIQAPSTPPTSLATNDSPVSISTMPPTDPLPICEVCGTLFSTNSNLYRHRRVCHSEIGKRKVYYCGYKDCDYRGPRKDNVDKHRRLKHGLRVEKRNKNGTMV